ncbi:MAG: hypothetical protein FWF07_04840 [Methanomassiliicoccaceae archaeon]|nr:hypothetical protein [Methanomassiliicoccaceae archaeon]
MDVWKTWAVFTVVFWIGALLWAAVALSEGNMNAAWGSVLAFFFVFAVFGTVRMMQTMPPAGKRSSLKKKE